MKPITETSTPRRGFRNGELTDQHFAAQLGAVVRNCGGCPAYGDPDAFFELTYPTAGLKGIVRGVFDRVHSAFDTVIGPIGEVTVSFTAVLNSTEHLTGAGLLEGEMSSPHLEELRRALQEARSKAHRRDFDNSTLEAQDVDEGSWRFDRADTPQRVAYALNDPLPDPESNLVCSWKVEGDRARRYSGLTRVGRAIPEPRSPSGVIHLLTACGGRP